MCEYSVIVQALMFCTKFVLLSLCFSRFSVLAPREDKSMIIVALCLMSYDLSRNRDVLITKLSHHLPFYFCLSKIYYLLKIVNKRFEEKSNDIINIFNYFYQ